MSEDWIWDDLQNTYRYVKNTVVNAIDPKGLGTILPDNQDDAWKPPSSDGTKEPGSLKPGDIASGLGDWATGGKLPKIPGFGGTGGKGAHKDGKTGQFRPSIDLDTDFSIDDTDFSIDDTDFSIDDTDVSIVPRVTMYFCPELRVDVQCEFKFNVDDLKEFHSFKPEVSHPKIKLVWNPKTGKYETQIVIEYDGQPPLGGDYQIDVGIGIRS